RVARIAACSKPQSRRCAYCSGSDGLEKKNTVRTGLPGPWRLAWGEARLMPRVAGSEPQVDASCITAPDLVVAAGCLADALRKADPGRVAIKQVLHVAEDLRIDAAQVETIRQA